MPDRLAPLSCIGPFSRVLRSNWKANIAMTNCSPEAGSSFFVWNERPHSGRQAHRIYRGSRRDIESSEDVTLSINTRDDIILDHTCLYAIFATARNAHIAR